MPAQFCSFSGVPDPVDLPLAAAGLLTAHTLADTSLTWSDGTTGTIPADTQATSVYGGASFDNAASVFYLLAVKGSSVPVLVKEADIDTADALIGGTPSWAKWQRIAGGTPHPCPQP